MSQKIVIPNSNQSATPLPSDPSLSEPVLKSGLQTYIPGDKIGGRYKVYEVITQGGMGDVYFCHDLKDDTPVALKTFKSHLVAKNPRIRDLFYQEVGLWVGLEKHPNIVHCYYLNILDNLPFMFLEWVADPDRERVDLQYWLHRRGPLDLRLALEVTIDICRGLSYANQKQPGLVHRDLKPTNILITQDKTAKITDFGLATIAQDAHLDLGDISLTGDSQSLLHFGSFVGTPAYAPPEHWSSPETVDGRADIYAIGCILYEMLTGNRPFHVEFRPATFTEKSAWLETWRLAHEQTPSSMPGDWPAEVSAIIQICLQKEPGQRFATADELLQTLEMVYQQLFTELPKTVTNEPLTAEDYNDRGRAYANINLIEKALADFEQAIQLDPKYFPAYVNRGILYGIFLQRYTEALSDFTQVIQLNPDLALTYSNRARVYANLKEYNYALADFEQAIRLDPNDALTYYHRGKIYNNLHRYAEALTDFAEAIKIDPGLADVYRVRGLVYANLQRHQEALADYNQAIRLDPFNEASFNSRGNTYADLQQYEEAIADYNQSIRLNSKFADPYYNRARTYDVLQQYEEAIADYTQAIYLNSSFAEAYNNRGVIRRYLQHHEEALADFRQAIQINPNLTPAYMNIGITFVELDQHQEALSFIEKAQQLGVSEAGEIITRIRREMGLEKNNSEETVS